MAIVPQKSLFSWGDIEVQSDMDRLSLVLDNLPDDRIIQYLEEMRGNGRDDYPVRAMWNALIAGVVLQHPSLASLSRELSRNPLLLETCGFNPLPKQAPPKPYLETDEQGVTRIHHVSQPPQNPAPQEVNLSRFMGNVIALEENLGMISGLVPLLREELMAELPDYGQHQGYDGKAIESHSTGRVNRESGQTSDPDAAWGKHKTEGINADGTAWSKVKIWFGFTLHLIADTEYEIPVAFDIKPANEGESPALREAIGQLFEESPELATRCDTFSADKGLDCAQTKALLWDKYKVRPLIDTRELWQEEKKDSKNAQATPIMRPFYTQRVDTILYTEKGSMHCRCPASGEIRDLAFQGFESDRNSLKYRCPAAAYGLHCKGQETCHKAGNVQPGEYGRIIRVSLDEQDRRIFTPTPYGSPSWKRGYKRRSALERINSRIDHGYFFEYHFIRGLHKMKAQMGLSLAVMMAMALGHIRRGSPEKMRSLVGAIPSTA
jgi:hypothetical protein